MKILVVSQYFWPESFRINDLALDLVKRGYDITVLTGNPNYPQGKFYKSYGFRYSSEIYNGIKIYRVPITPRGNSGFKLALNYLSFVISGSIFFIYHKKKYDSIFTVNYSPITAAIPAIIYKKIKNKKLFLWVQDLWPESVRAASNVKSTIIDNILLKIVKYIYRNSDKILVSNEGFCESIISKGVNKTKLSYLPNWAEDIFEDEASIDEAKYKNLLPKGFIVMFAGNIGEAQDFESIINAVELTKHINNIKWVIVGDGRKKDWLQNEIFKRNLNSTIFLIGRYPVEEMSSFFIHADLTLVTLKDEHIFSLTVPGKIQSYIAFGKPILTMLNGAGNKVVEDANCGFVANASDFSALAKNIIKAYSLPKEELLEMGMNGKMYYNKHFKKSISIDHLCELFEQDCNTTEIKSSS